MRGGPRGENWQNFLWSRKKLLSPIPPPSFLFFKSIFHVRLRLLSFTSSMLHLVWSRERNDKTLTPTPTGIFLMTASDWEFCATVYREQRSLLFIYSKHDALRSIKQGSPITHHWSNIIWDVRWLYTKCRCISLHFKKLGFDNNDYHTRSRLIFVFL